ncbi:MAG: hypothetical protein JNL88_06700 [Bacteroidia bacterium]|nr:hypothetical protein [Bacteroidia bacterium]
MLDQLINLVKEHAGDAIIKNPAIPDEKNTEAIRETAGGIMDVLKGQLNSGKLDALNGLLKGGSADNPLTGQVSQEVQQRLASHFNIDTAQAGKIASQLIPVVLQQLSKKTNDPNDNSFTMEGILSGLGNSGAGNALNAIKGLFGK